MPRQSIKRKQMLLLMLTSGVALLLACSAFLAYALSDDDGVNKTAAILFAVIAWSDYADGIAARVTGQYS